MKKNKFLIIFLFSFSSYCLAENTSFSVETGKVKIPFVQVNNVISYVDVILQLNENGLLSIIDAKIPDEQSQLSSSIENSVYFPSTGIVEIPAVEIDGEIAYIDVILELNENGLFSIVGANIPEDNNHGKPI